MSEQMTDRDAEMVDLYLGAFIEHALRSGPNSATATNGRNAALMLVKAARDQGRRGERWRCAALAAKAGWAKYAAEIVDDIGPAPEDQQYAE